MADTFYAHVIGRIWQGCSASYFYEFDHEPTAEELRRKAGDFELISDFKVDRVTVTNEPTAKGWRKVVEHNVVKEWDQELSEDVYVNAMSA